MGWMIWMIPIFIGIVLLIIGTVWLDKVERGNKPNKHCMNCRKKTYDGIMDIRCRNKRSEFHGAMVDDYACCKKWRG